MQIFLNILLLLAFFAGGYLIGGFPTGVVIGKIFFGKDPRDYGSHNSGGTNAGRVFGKKFGILVIVIDIIKALIALYAAWAIAVFVPWGDFLIFTHSHNAIYYWICALGVTLGHCYSPFLGFKGGKAVACYNGIVGGVSWLSFIVCVGAFFPMFFLKNKKVMSKTSIMQGAVLLIYVWIMALIVEISGNELSFFMFTGASNVGIIFSYEEAIVTTLGYALLVYRHRENIARLHKGEEKPIDWSGKGTIEENKN